MAVCVIYKVKETLLSAGIRSIMGMRVFKYTRFSRFAGKEGITDHELEKIHQVRKQHSGNGPRKRIEHADLVTA